MHDIGISPTQVVARIRSDAAKIALHTTADKGSAFSQIRAGVDTPRIETPVVVNEDGSRGQPGRLGIDELDFTLA